MSIYYTPIYAQSIKVCNFPEKSCIRAHVRNPKFGLQTIPPTPKEADGIHNYINQLPYCFTRIKMSLLLRVSRRSLSLRPSAVSVRCLSQSADNGSHSDFMPKKKVNVPEGMEDVLKLIDKQVKENDILLYMKG